MSNIRENKLIFDVYTIKELEDGLRLSGVTIKKILKKNPQIKTIRLSTMLYVDKRSFDDFIISRTGSYTPLVLGKDN